MGVRAVVCMSALRAEDVEVKEGKGEASVPCGGLRKELLQCLRDSDCVKVHGLSPRECLKEGAPGQRSECMSFRLAFFECKRSMLDNRQRFRGRKGY